MLGGEKGVVISCRVLKDDLCNKYTRYFIYTQVSMRDTQIHVRESIPDGKESNFKGSKANLCSRCL